jgi:5-(carboxyamino)imidazole ribonucleotide mutase
MDQTSETKVSVAIIMGSDSDYSVMKEAAQVLRELGVGYQISIVSAHRTPLELAEFAQSARKNGIRVIIAGAGGAAHLPGMVAAYTELPVIGVPVPIGVMEGQDALLSIVQMPKGVPVATVAIGNAWNAGILAAQILGTACDSSLEARKLLDRVAEYKQKLRKQVLDKKLPQD